MTILPENVLTNYTETGGRRGLSEAKAPYNSIVSSKRECTS